MTFFIFIFGIRYFFGNAMDMSSSSSDSEMYPITERNREDNALANEDEK